MLRPGRTGTAGDGVSFSWYDTGIAEGTFNVHVWTAPAWQKLSDDLTLVGLQSCVRPWDRKRQ